MFTNLDFNIFGEFKSKELEEEFLCDHWSAHKPLYLWSYNLCSFLLLLAGVFIDYKREFVWGSANILTMLRVLLVLFSIVMFPMYMKRDNYPKSFNHYGLFIMMFSSIIILLLNLMTGGKSNTMLAGILIISTSYYVVVPNRLLFAIFPSLLQIFNFSLFYKGDNLGVSGHIYMCFMIMAINTVLIFFKIMFNKSNRNAYLINIHQKQALEAKNTILNIIGHDLKNPLTIINLRTGIAKKHIEKGNIEKVSKSIEGIEESTQKLTELLKSLLSWALTKNLSKTSSYNDIEECISNAITQTSEQIKNKEIVFHMNLEPKKFNFDCNMMETIIRNLLSNSIKFTESGKSISLEGYTKDNEYILTLKDEGTGIKESMIEKILDGTNTHSVTGTNEEAGTGLGLNIVHQFLEYHNAKFEINSKLGIGTEFILRFNTTI